MSFTHSEEIHLLMVKLSHNRPSLEHGATSQSRVGWQPSGVLAPARAT